MFLYHFDTSPQNADRYDTREDADFRYIKFNENRIYTKSNLKKNYITISVLEPLPNFNNLNSSFIFGSAV